MAAANVDGRLAIPIQPKEPSCHAISIQVSIISWKDGSTPPAAFGLNADHQPEAHISSTIAGESVRKRSDSAASAETRSRIPRARSTTDTSATSAAPLGLLPYIIGDEDRFASLIGFRPYLARWEHSLITPGPILHSCLFRCLRLGLRLFPRLEGVSSSSSSSSSGLSSTSKTTSYHRLWGCTRVSTSPVGVARLIWTFSRLGSRRRDEGLQCLRQLDVQLRLMSASALPWYIATPDILAPESRWHAFFSGRAAASGPSGGARQDD